MVGQGKPCHTASTRHPVSLVLKEKTTMRTMPLLSTSRRWTAALLLALLVTLSAVYTPVALQQMAGVSLTATAYACGSQGGGGC